MTDVKICSSPSDLLANPSQVTTRKARYDWLRLIRCLCQVGGHLTPRGVYSWPTDRFPQTLCSEKLASARLIPDIRRNIRRVMYE